MSNPPSLEPKHETTDVRSKPLVLSALALAVAVGIVCVALISFFDLLENLAERRDPKLSPLVGEATPPKVRLQEDPAADLRRLRAAENQALDRYRWIDQKGGVVQLPIDRAMDLLIEQGLPETSAEVPVTETPGAEAAGNEGGEEEVAR